MSFLHQVIKLNNNLDNDWSISEQNGCIIAEYKTDKKKQMFQNAEEFFIWFKKTAISAIKNRY